MGMKKMIEKVINNRREAGGISKPGQIDLSIVAPCSVKKVEHCAYIIAYTKHETQIGTRLRIAFASSTSPTLHSPPPSLEPTGVSKAL